MIGIFYSPLKSLSVPTAILIFIILLAAGFTVVTYRAWRADARRRT